VNNRDVLLFHCFITEESKEMGYVNAQIIVGRLGADPVLRIEDGATACRFPVGTTLLYRKNGRTYRETEWHNVVVYGEKAKEASKSLQRGSEIFVKGPKRTMSYSISTNVPRIRAEIVAEQMQWAGRPGQSAGQMPSEITIGEPPEGDGEGTVEVQTGIRIEDLGPGIITPAGGVARSNAPGASSRGAGAGSAGQGGMQFTDLTDPHDEDDFVAGFVSGPVDELAELEDLSARIGTGQDTYFGRKRAGEGTSQPMSDLGQPPSEM
jgi:single-strand DNA-binding protein